MTLETLTTVTLMTELLLALRANDPKGFRTLLEMSLDELGLDVVDELTRDFLAPVSNLIDVCDSGHQSSSWFSGW